MKMDTVQIIKMIGCMQKELSENREQLIKIDSDLGDGDLGIYMDLGITKGYEKVQTMLDKTPADVFKAVGMAFSVEAPSTMGTLIGTAFIQAGKDMGAAVELSETGFVQIYRSFCDGIIRRGKAGLGDKTILDVLIPASEAAARQLAAGGSYPAISKAAYEAAENGVESAKQLRAVYGRPSYYGDLTIGKYDGGTIVGMLLCKAMWDSLN